MLIILSQKIESASEYSDELFEIYHYPARYKNQIHEGDTFVYYQGNRYVKERRYYFGVGSVGKISTLDGENFYASLNNGQKFNSKVPIYHPNGKYVEQLGYDSVRKSPVPPWQSSVRPLSQQAFDYIIATAGVQIRPTDSTSVDELKERLKSYVRAFYRDNNVNAIVEIEHVASEIMHALNMEEIALKQEACIYKPAYHDPEKIEDLINYCKTTHITYSYKPVLLLAFFKCANNHGVMKMTYGINWVRKFYQGRRDQSLVVEKKKSIYMKVNVTDEEIRRNLIANPIKALTDSGYFVFNHKKQELAILQGLWPSIGQSDITRIEKICIQRLEDYFMSD